jgi:hypothetical protein
MGYAGPGTTSRGQMRAERAASRGNRGAAPTAVASLPAATPSVSPSLGIGPFAGARGTGIDLAAALAGPAPTAVASVAPALSNPLAGTAFAPWGAVPAEMMATPSPQEVAHTATQSVQHSINNNQSPAAAAHSALAMPPTLG